MLPKIKHSKMQIKSFLHRADPRIVVMIGLTYFCQCRCPHCAIAIYEKNKRKEFTTQELLKLISQFPRTKIKGVYFFGGEPLLRKDVFKLINAAHKRWMITSLSTNGYLLNEKAVKKLKKAGLTVIKISIDSADSKIHNKFRGVKNLFERAITGIKNCKKQGLITCISTYATKENLKNGDLKRIVSLGERLEVDYLKILPPILTGKWLKAKEMGLNPKERKQFKNFHQPGFIYLEDDYCQSMPKKFIYISPYGDVQPCFSIPFSFGNVREEPLGKILKRMWKHPMFNLKISRECPMNNKEFRQKYISKTTSSTRFPIRL